MSSLTLGLNKMVLVLNIAAKISLHQQCQTAFINTAHCDL